MADKKVVTDLNTILGDIVLEKTGELRHSAELSADKKFSRKVTYRINFNGTVLKDALESGVVRNTLVPLQNAARDLESVEAFHAWINQWKQEDGSYVIDVHATDKFGKEYFTAPLTDEERQAKLEADIMRLDKVKQLESVRGFMEKAGLDLTEIDKQIADAKAENAKAEANEQEVTQ